MCVCTQVFDMTNTGEIRPRFEAESLSAVAYGTSKVRAALSSRETEPQRHGGTDT